MQSVADNFTHTHTQNQIYGVILTSISCTFISYFSLPPRVAVLLSGAPFGSGAAGTLGDVQGACGQRAALAAVLPYTTRQGPGASGSAGRARLMGK